VVASGPWWASALLTPRPWSLGRGALTALGLMAGLVPFTAEVRRSANAAEHSHEVYVSRVNQGHFLAQHFPTGVVAIEDLGAIAWWRPGPLIDLFGLANSEVCSRLLNHTWNAQATREMARRDDVKVALVRAASLPKEPLHNHGSRPA
jgi:hypothetical protein